MRVAGAALAAILLSGCQSSPGPSATGSFNEAHGLYTALTGTMKTCWFSGDPAFSAYIYSPEINAGTPRILIVPKSEPTGLPLLVVETRGQASADYYGPLLASGSGPRIRADLDRWIRGGRECA